VSGNQTSSLTLLGTKCFVRSPAGISRASLPQAQHRLSRLLLICRRAATSQKTKATFVETTPSGFHGYLPAAAYVQHSRRAVT
jgi:hypothetical protein